MNKYILKVKCADNDFSENVREACQTVMESITKGKKFNDSMLEYFNYMETSSLATIDKAISVCAMGSYIKKLGADVLKAPGEFVGIQSEQDDLDYLYNMIIVEEVNASDIEFDNYEVMFIDFSVPRVMYDGEA